MTKHILLHVAHVDKRNSHEFAFRDWQWVEMKYHARRLLRLTAEFLLYRGGK